jgi:D-amino-acid dehydrogenase
MLAKVPGWLTDREGPLVVRPSYLPQAMPWLRRWIQASRMEQVLKISDAMRALHKDALVCWRELLGPEHFDDLIRVTGQVRIWEARAPARRSRWTSASGTGSRRASSTRTTSATSIPEISPDIKQG